jgi:hypothetical protein
MSDTTPRLAIVDVAYDSDTSDLPFGKRWRDETVTLLPEHLEALRQGKLVAVDIQAEYVLYLKLALDQKEPGRG